MRFCVRDLHLDGDQRPFIRRLQAPLEAEIRHQARDRHASLLTPGVEQLGHREVGIALRIERVGAVAVDLDAPDAGPPFREARGVVEELPYLLGWCGASRAVM